MATQKDPANKFLTTIRIIFGIIGIGLLPMILTIFAIGSATAKLWQLFVILLFPATFILLAIFIRKKHKAIWILSLLVSLGMTAYGTIMTLGIVIGFPPGKALALLFLSLFSPFSWIGIAGLVILILLLLSSVRRYYWG
jgi:hypothetical protein